MLKFDWCFSNRLQCLQFIQAIMVLTFNFPEDLKCLLYHIQRIAPPSCSSVLAWSWIPHAVIWKAQRGCYFAYSLWSHVPYRAKKWNDKYIKRRPWKRMHSSKCQWNPRFNLQLRPRPGVHRRQTKWSQIWSKKSLTKKCLVQTNTPTKRKSAVLRHRAKNLMRYTPVVNANSFQRARGKETLGRCSSGAFLRNWTDHQFWFVC